MLNPPPERHTQPDCALLCDVRSVAMSRRYTERRMPHDTPATIRDDVLLGVSELVSNAILKGVHVRSGFVGLTTHLVDDDLMSFTVEVTNPHSEVIGPLQEEAPDPDAEHGRGLFLVAAFSDSWGSRFDNEGRLVVWATRSWLSSALPDRGWLAGWELTRDTAGRASAHRSDESLTLRGGTTLTSLRQPIVSVNQVLVLRERYPRWEITYDRHEKGPTWFVARRRTPATHRTHGVLDTVTARTSAELGDRLAAQCYATSRAECHRTHRPVS